MALAAAALGASIGVLDVRDADLLSLQIAWSPSLGLAALAGGLALLAMARWPGTGACLLVALTFSNASEVLVREHGMPSVLQLFVPMVLVAIAWSSASRARTGAPAPGGPRLGIAPDTVFLVASLAWVATILASTTWALDRDIADATLADVSKAVFLGLVLAHVVDDVATWRHVAWSMLAAGVVLAGFSSYQVLSGDWTQSFGGFARFKEAQISGSDLGARATGPLADPNFYAQALLPLVPMALALALAGTSRASRALGWGSAAIVTMGIVSTSSRGGELALGAGLAGLALLERHRLRARHFAAALAVLALVLALMPASFFTRRLETLAVLLPGAQDQLAVHDSSVEKRKVLMATAAAMAVDHPALGVGAGNFGTHFEEYGDRVGARARIDQDPGERAFPHSLYLEMLAETGLVGFLAFCLAAAGALWCSVAAGRSLDAAGDAGSALLARCVGLGLASVLLSSAILHGDYPRYLWMTLGLAVAGLRASRNVAQRAAAPEVATT